MNAAPTLDASVLVTTSDGARLEPVLHALGAQEADGLTWESIVIGPGDSLEQALARARGRWLILLDDASEPAADWLRSLLEATIRWPDDSIFAGRVEPAFPEAAPGWIERARPRHARWAFRSYAPRTDEGPAGEPPVPTSVAIRAELLRRARPARLDDRALLDVARAGERTIHVPAAVVTRRIQPELVRYDAFARAALLAGREHARLEADQGNWPVLGVPPGRLKALATDMVRVALRSLASADERRAATIDFHHSRGDVLQRMQDVRDDPARRWFPGPGAVRGALLRLGVRGLVLAPVQALLARIARSEAVVFFETEIAAAAFARPAIAGIEARIYQGVDRGRAVRLALARVGRPSAAEIDRRLARGHSVSVAFSEGRAVGFEWAAFTDSFVPELRSTIRVGPDEVLAYDAFVLPDMRGRRIMHALDTAQIELAAALGRRRQIMYIRTTNRASLRSMAAAGKRRTFAMRRVIVPRAGIDRITFDDPAAGRARLIVGPPATR